MPVSDDLLLKVVHRNSGVDLEPGWRQLSHYRRVRDFPPCLTRVRIPKLYGILPS
jgi:hypothetical protein